MRCSMCAVAPAGIRCRAPIYEGRGVGYGRVWLAAAADPTVRAHGFYRSLGWRPTGELPPSGDEILEYCRHIANTLSNSNLERVPA